MGVRCSQGISFIHQHKQLHRDIKPGNILMTNSGVVKIADFGIAKQLESTMSFAKTSCGTKVYLAPERFKIEARVRVVIARFEGCALRSLACVELHVCMCNAPVVPTVPQQCWFHCVSVGAHRASLTRV